VGSWAGSKTGRNFLRKRWGEELMQNKSIYFYWNISNSWVFQIFQFLLSNSE
jgi:hypothetical protein